ncbi:MAG TPA: hypothetical protein VKW78_08435 [Terriglobales bacterium]|nr:hypothetical protein [Terriglobales bacterium]
MDLTALARTVHEFLSESRGAIIVEDGATLFDLQTARYSLSTDRGKCVLHMWSEERNCVRRVLDAEQKNEVLKLTVQRLGQPRPNKLEICRGRDHRTASAKKSQRAGYHKLLERVLRREYPGAKIAPLTSTIDLERSFGPIYARGALYQGTSAWAVIGVNENETQASIDSSLTIGILWLDYLRQRESERRHVRGLKLFVPAGHSAMVRERMAHLHRHAASWELYEVDAKTATVDRIDTDDVGNISTRLVHCPDNAAARQRFAASIARIGEFVQGAEVHILTPVEISFRVCGLEFARARVAFATGSFHAREEIVFGVGANEAVLNQESESFFRELCARLSQSRRVDRASGSDPLWRMVPERWLESLVIKDVHALDHRLYPRFVYSQVPAFSAADRAMIDVLSCTRDGRLAVLELKADEDIHLPLQGLDYWARVRWHHARGEFQDFGYFPGVALCGQSPLLLLVAPALHIHPATDTLLRYFSPEVDWNLIALDEHWRGGLKVVFRKRAILPLSQ